MKTQTGTLLFTTKSGINVYDCGDYFTFILPAPDGTTGAEWIKRIKIGGGRVSNGAEGVLQSNDFNPTSSVTKTEVVVIKGITFNDGERLDKNIRKMATDQKLETPNAEIGCLIHENFTNEEIGRMNLRWIAIMHEPIKTSYGATFLSVSTFHHDLGLSIFGANGLSEWDHRGGFAFSVSQTNTVQEIL